VPGEGWLEEDKVSLIEKTVTPMVIAANRANSKKSTGPRTPTGKLRVARNAGKYFVFGQISPSRMRELGEDPADFERLRQSLRSALAPRDGFEEMLVEEMVVNRWRLGRVRRAEMGILAVQQGQLENRLRVAPVNRGITYDNLLIRSYGLSAASDSAEKYVQILQLLFSLAEKVEKEGFFPEGLRMLRTVYGFSPGVTGLGLICEYKAHLESPGEDAQPQTQEETEAARERFLKNLEREIDGFLAYAKGMKLAQDMPLPESVRDAQLIPALEDIERIHRYEVMLQREFERSMKELLEWRDRKRGERFS
jgi:hypothetical protein